MEDIKNNFESKISFECNVNSKGYTTSLKVYQGTTKEEIHKVIDQVIELVQKSKSRLHKH